MRSVFLETTQQVSDDPLSSLCIVHVEMLLISLFTSVLPDFNYVSESK